MLFRRVFTLAAIVLLGLTSTGRSQVVGGGIGGRLTDESGAALPGVTVSIACLATTSVLATVTDGTGDFIVQGLPAGPCAVTFELSGFEKVVHERIMVSGGEVASVHQQLSLAKLQETVTVVAKAPPEPKPVPPKPRPRVQPGSIPAHDVDSVCGPGRPAAVPAVPSIAARLAANRDDSERTMFVPGDAIVIDAGSADGLSVGQNFVVRRRYRVSDLSWDNSATPIGVHSAGLVQVFEVSDASAIVAVVYACDAFRQGDELEAFDPEPYRLARTDGVPDFTKPARVIFGDEAKMVGAPERLMVIDQGTDDGLEIGQRVTLFRRSRFGESGVSRVGEAVIVAARANWSRIRIDSVRDVVFAGDQAAPHRTSSVARKASSQPKTR